MQLLQEIKFGSRKRGSNTIPAKIFRTFENYEIITDLTNLNPSEKFINFYRIPKKEIFNDNLLFTYSQSKEELIQRGLFTNALNLSFLKYNSKIVSNGFYYSKYYNMLYFPTYFYSIHDINMVYNIKKSYKYGFYNRLECPNDREILKKYSPEELLIFGNFGNEKKFDSLTDQGLFFNSFETLIVNNEPNDSVSNTLLEGIFLKKKIKMENNFNIANDNKALLEARFRLGYDNLFKALDNLNIYCWYDLTEDNFNDRLDYINKLIKQSVTFDQFLQKGFL